MDSIGCEGRARWLVAPVTAARGEAPRGRATALVGVAFALVYVVWGSTYLAIAWAVETIPPFEMIGARCLLAGAILYGWTRWRGAPRPSVGDWRLAAVTGTLLFATGQAVLAWAETRIASGPAALLIATEPLFIVLLGWRGGRALGSPRGPRPSWPALLALLVGFVGVGLMVLPGGGRLDLLGAAAALLASLSWSIGVLRSRIGARTPLPPVQLAGMQLLAGGAVLSVIALTSGEGAALAAADPSVRSLLAFGYLVVFGSVVTYGAYVWLLDRVGPARLSTHAYVNPVVAVVLGTLLGGEPVSATLIVSMLLILGAVVVLVRPDRRAERNAVMAARGPHAPTATVTTS